jgi:hypothetical protein
LNSGNAGAEHTIKIYGFLLIQQNGAGMWNNFETIVILVPFDKSNGNRYLNLCRQIIYCRRIHPTENENRK